MHKLLTAVGLFLASCMAHAATNLEAATAPAPTVDLIYVVLFLVFFFGMIIWFFWYMWRRDQKQGSKKKNAD